jgi:hypothetical protein
MLVVGGVILLSDPKGDVMKWAPLIRRLLATALLAAVTALIVGGVSLARAGGGDNGKDETFVLFDKQTKSAFVETNPSGPVGNEFIFHSTLSNSGGQVGTLDALCVVVFVNRAQCHGTVRLPGGTLTISGLVSTSNSPTTSHASIDGGTGRYDEARGQIRIVQHTETTSTDTFDID